MAKSSTGGSWVSKLVDKLTSPMAFVILADYIVGGQAIDFYKAQSKAQDALSTYSVYGFWLYMIINLWIIYGFYRIEAKASKLKQVATAA